VHLFIIMGLLFNLFGGSIEAGKMMWVFQRKISKEISIIACRICNIFCAPFFICAWIYQSLVISLVAITLAIYNVVCMKARVYVYEKPVHLHRQTINILNSTRKATHALVLQSTRRIHDLFITAPYFIISPSFVRLSSFIVGVAISTCNIIRKGTLFKCIHYDGKIWALYEKWIAYCGYVASLESELSKTNDHLRAAEIELEKIRSELSVSKARAGGIASKLEVKVLQLVDRLQLGGDILSSSRSKDNAARIDLDLAGQHEDLLEKYNLQSESMKALGKEYFDLGDK